MSDTSIEALVKEFISKPASKQLPPTGYEIAIVVPSEAQLRFVDQASGDATPLTFPSAEFRGAPQTMPFKVGLEDSSKTLTAHAVAMLVVIAVDAMDERNAVHFRNGNVSSWRLTVKKGGTVCLDQPGNGPVDRVFPLNC